MNVNPIACHSLAWEQMPWEEAFDALAEAGFCAIEGFCEAQKTFRDKIEKAQHELEWRGLKWLGLPYRGNLAHPENGLTIRKEVLSLAAFLRGIRGSFVVVEIESREEIQSIRQDFRIAAETLNELAGYCSDYDIQIGVQPRVGSRIQSEEEIDRLLNLVDLHDVFFCPDTGHLQMAEMDPARIISIYGSCIRHVHCSDVPAPIPPGERDPEEAVRIFCPPGQGILDFAAIMKALKSHAYTGWLSVLYETGNENPALEAIQARQFLQSILEGGKES